MSYPTSYAYYYCGVCEMRNNDRTDISTAQNLLRIANLMDANNPDIWG